MEVILIFKDAAAFESKVLLGYEVRTFNTVSLFSNILGLVEAWAVMYFSNVLAGQTFHFVYIL